MDLIRRALLAALGEVGFQIDEENGRAWIDKDHFLTFKVWGDGAGALSAQLELVSRDRNIDLRYGIHHRIIIVDLLNPHSVSTLVESADAVRKAMRLGLRWTQKAL
jgi:hypothetical protein